jgi:dUTP pyrophosphatase
VIDTPGYLDFVGEAAQALRVAGSALIVVDGKAGVEVGTELAWDMVTKEKLPRAFFINKCDDPDARFKQVSAELHEKFGSTICPVVIPLMEGDKIVGLLDLVDMRARAFANGKDGQDIEIPAGGRALVHTGLIMILPPNYEAQVRPRSGLALKNGVTVLNTPGTIDAGYRGEVGVILANFGMETFKISKGDKVAQIVIAPVTRADIVETDIVDVTDRGEGGFGSTGI